MILCSTRVRGIEVELTSLLGTPVAISFLSRNEVQIPFSCKDYMVTCSEINVHSTDCTPHVQDTIALSHMNKVA